MNTLLNINDEILIICCDKHIWGTLARCNEGDDVKGVETDEECEACNARMETKDD